jgi:hypothetical protein
MRADRSTRSNWSVRTESSSHEVMRWRLWRRLAIAFMAYAALAIALTFPLVLHLSSVVPHDTGDPMLSTAILWWNAHVLPVTPRWWNGFAFYPAPGFMAFSDHRLGESLLATPLQWLGCSPVTAYNITLLATFPLCALTAHWLGFVVTKRHDAAAICGLAYGFCPYRVAHLPHLELLGAFGMPAALAALHQYLGTRERRWLAVYAAALTLQGLWASYYLLFFAVLAGLWILWFVGWRDPRAAVGIAAASACSIVALGPVGIGYSRIHAYYGLGRSLREIVPLSADLTAFVTASPLLALWGWATRWARLESELFPGATIAALAATAAIMAWRRRTPRGDLDRVRTWLLAAACVSATIAVCGWTLAPWRIDIPGLSISSDAPFKPLSLAVLAFAVWLGASSRMRDAYARRSTFAFYLLATIAMIVCSLGPRPMLAGHQILYEAPYNWLMKLPGFGSVRVPARFGMLVMLTLSVSGALALGRLQLRERTRRAVGIGLMAGIIADTWMTHLPLPAVPDFWPAKRADGFAAVLELPLHDGFTDFAAMYRVTDHHHPVMNGDSGYEPPHYFTLKTALSERDSAIFDGLPAGGRVLVVVDRLADRDRGWETFLVASPRVQRLAPDDRWDYFAAEPPPPPAPPCSGDPLPIVAAADDRGPVDLTLLTDRNPKTWWSTRRAQQAGDILRLDLGRAAQPCAIFVSIGEFRASYARHLTVETSVDAVNWTTVAGGRTAGLTMRAALEDPKNVTIPIVLQPTTGRFVRLRADESHAMIPWVVTDVLVRGARVQE